MAEHYFDGSPTSDDRRRDVTTRIWERELVFTTSSGVFSQDGLDKATAVLLRNSTPPTGGVVLDLGCGWGPIACSLATTSATVWAVDVNERSLDLVRRNAAQLGLTNINAVRPEDVPADALFTSIWSNPPIRVGKNELHAMLLHWLPRLEPGSDAWLVVQRNLGSDSLQRWLQAELPREFAVLRAATNKGYRVLRCRRRSGHTGLIDLPQPIDIVDETVD